jgi:hypothetical protein
MFILSLSVFHLLKCMSYIYIYIYIYISMRLLFREVAPTRLEERGRYSLVSERYSLR